MTPPAALIPAAGLSRRFGRPKLLEPVGGVPLLARVIAALQGGGVGPIVVVTAPVAAPGAIEIHRLAAELGSDVVNAPHPPADMRATVELGLAYLAATSPPTSLLLTPGDCPGISLDLVARLITRGSRTPGRIVVPRHGDQSGHPVLIPWDLASQIPDLPTGVGVNALLTQNPDRVDFVAAAAAALVDLDTPEDFQAWTQPDQNR